MSDRSQTSYTASGRDDVSDILRCCRYQKSNKVDIAWRRCISQPRWRISVSEASNRSCKQKVIEERVPILGICLGPAIDDQMEREGDVAGLGWLDAVYIEPENAQPGVRVPHMGWNTVKRR